MAENPTVLEDSNLVTTFFVEGENIPAALNKETCSPENIYSEDCSTPLIPVTYSSGTCQGAGDSLYTNNKAIGIGTESGKATMTIRNNMHDLEDELGSPVEYCIRVGLCSDPCAEGGECIASVSSNIGDQEGNLPAPEEIETAPKLLCNGAYLKDVMELSIRYDPLDERTQVEVDLGGTVVVVPDDPTEGTPTELDEAGLEAFICDDDGNRVEDQTGKVKIMQNEGFNVCTTVSGERFSLESMDRVTLERGSVRVDVVSEETDENDFEINDKSIRAAVDALPAGLLLRPSGDVARGEITGTVQVTVGFKGSRLLTASRTAAARLSFHFTAVPLEEEEEGGFCSGDVFILFAPFCFLMDIVKQILAYFLLSLYL